MLVFSRCGSEIHVDGRFASNDLTGVVARANADIQRYKNKNFQATQVIVITWLNMFLYPCRYYTRFRSTVR